MIKAFKDSCQSSRPTLHVLTVSLSREREKERESVCVCVCVRACPHGRICVCVSAVCVCSRRRALFLIITFLTAQNLVHRYNTHTTQAPAHTSILTIQNLHTSGQQRHAVEKKTAARIGKHWQVYCFGKGMSRGLS